jgi:hypothetical protein
VAGEISVTVGVTTPSAGVTGMAIISKERTTAATRILKNLLRFICHLPYCQAQYILTNIITKKLKKGKGFKIKNPPSPIGRRGDKLKP